MIYIYQKFSIIIAKLTKKISTLVLVFYFVWPNILKQTMQLMMKTNT